MPIQLRGLTLDALNKHRRALHALSINSQMAKVNPSDLAKHERAAK